MTIYKKNLTQSHGFTLIEIMIALAIMGILVSIAIPSYQEHIAKSHRAEVRIQLTQAASFMERFYSENNRYDQTTAGVPIAIPVIVNTWYNFIFNFGQTTFTITATPLLSHGADVCGIYSLTNTGAWAATGAGGAVNCL